VVVKCDATTQWSKKEKKYTNIHFYHAMLTPWPCVLPTIWKHTYWQVMFTDSVNRLSWTKPALTDRVNFIFKFSYSFFHFGHQRRRAAFTGDAFFTPLECATPTETASVDADAATAPHRSYLILSNTWCSATMVNHPCILRCSVAQTSKAPHPNVWPLITQMSVAQLSGDCYQMIIIL